MAERYLRIVSWLNDTPWIGICERCKKQFGIRRDLLIKPNEAKVSLEHQFREHECVPSPGMPNIETTH